MLAWIVPRDCYDITPCDCPRVISGRNRESVDIQVFHLSLFEMIYLVCICCKLRIDPVADANVFRNTIFHDNDWRIARHRLDSCVDKSLASAHGVEEVFGGAQTLHERTLDEPARLYTVVKFGKVRQRSILQRILHALAVDDLLTQ